MRTNRVSPNFRLQSATSGKQVSLDEIICNRLVLAFIPGVWAPWCRKFLDELDAALQLEGIPQAKVVAIVSQDYEELYRYVRAQKLDIEVLSDPNGVIGKRYGMFDEHLTEPMRISKPSVFILDSKKNIAHTFIGMHLMDRPSAEEIWQKLAEPLETDSRARTGIFNLLFRRYNYAAD